MRAQKGNVLFLILLAVVLFAALSYAITQSSRGSGNTDNEKASLIASEMLQWATSVQNAVTRLQIINGCSESEISFENPTISGYTFAASDKCKIFHTDGGGLNWKSFDQYRIPYADVPAFFQTYYDAPHYGGQTNFQNVGTTAAELFMLITHIQNEAVCTNITKQLQNTDAVPHTPTNTLLWTTKFVGSYSGSPGNVTHADLDGQFAGCMTTGTTPGYNFYYSLIER